MDVEPHEAIFVDDFIENIQAARQLGMVGVHFHDSLQARQDVIAALNH
jgi:FMN phosphatase YigB (HAD superfamily)